MTIETPQGLQLTIGQIIAALDKLHGNNLIHMAAVGHSNIPRAPDRHRQHADDVLIRAKYERASFMPVERFKLMLTIHASQERLPAAHCRGMTGDQSTRQGVAGRYIWQCRRCT